MDPPSWHPSTSEAASKPTPVNPFDSAESERTEYKLMPGSQADTSTEAGRQLMDDMVSASDAVFENRGLYDNSDRLYLAERLQEEREAHAKRNEENAAEIQKFRSMARKAQEERLTAAATDTGLSAAAADDKTDGSQLRIVVKRKKRHRSETSAPKEKPKAETSHLVQQPISASEGLLVGYSSDSSQEAQADDDKHAKVSRKK